MQNVRRLLSLAAIADIIKVAGSRGSLIEGGGNHILADAGRAPTIHASVEAACLSHDITVVINLRLILQVFHLDGWLLGNPMKLSQKGS